jgi:hypothetical protein
MPGIKNIKIVCFFVHQKSLKTYTVMLKIFLQNITLNKQKERRKNQKAPDSSVSQGVIDDLRLVGFAV